MVFSNPTLQDAANRAALEYPGDILRLYADVTTYQVPDTSAILAMFGAVSAGKTDVPRLRRIYNAAHHKNTYPDCTCEDCQSERD